MDANGARATTRLSEDSIRAYSDDHVHSPVDLHPMDYLAGVLEEIDVDGGRIGLEMDASYFTAKSYTRLQRNPRRDLRGYDAARQLGPDQKVRSGTRVHAPGGTDLRERDAGRPRRDGILAGTKGQIGFNTRMTEQ